MSNLEGNMGGMDDYARKEESWLDRAARHMPGYRGYKEKEVRREVDRLVRENVAERLEAARRALEEIELAVSRQGNLDLLGVVDQVGRKLRTVKDRFLYADYGYAGLFNVVKVDESDLEYLHRADAQSHEQAEAIERIVKDMQADSPSLRADIVLLDDHVEALDEVFHDREHHLIRMGR